MPTISTKYLPSTEASVQLTQYRNNQPALVILNEVGQTLMKATVSLPDIQLEPGQVIIKDYAENEGILQALIEKQIIHSITMPIPTGFVEVHLCNLRPESDWLLPKTW